MFDAFSTLLCDRSLSNGESHISWQIELILIIYFRIKPLIWNCLTNSLFLSKLNDIEATPTVSWILAQNTTVLGVLIEPLRVGTCGSFVSIWVVSRVTSATLLGLFFAPVRTGIILISFTISRLSHPSLCKRDNNTSVFGCSIPARSMMSKV